jgi:hypothetical protein
VSNYLLDIEHSFMYSMVTAHPIFLSIPASLLAGD